jgi:hypothetical protein
MNTSLPWPDGAEVLPIATLRPVLDRLSSLVTTHAEDAETIPGLAVAEEEVPADPPPALEQLVDELGGIALRGVRVLDLLVEDRTDVGPYTLLGDARTYYPLYETPDAAVVLTLDENGTPGAVHGIGEDLSLQLAAPDLPTYLGLFADALEATLAALDERGPAEEDSRQDRDEVAEQRGELGALTRARRDDGDSLGAVDDHVVAGDVGEQARGLCKRFGHQARHEAFDESAHAVPVGWVDEPVLVACRPDDLAAVVLGDLLPPEVGVAAAGEAVHLDVLTLVDERGPGSGPARGCLSVLLSVPVREMEGVLLPHLELRHLLGETDRQRKIMQQCGEPTACSDDHLFRTHSVA